MDNRQLEDLLASMTLKEKFGQLSQITGELYVGHVDDEMVETGPAYSRHILDEETLYTIGSVIGASSAKMTNRIQEEYLKRSRLKIPLLFMHDAIHGYRTIFPIPLGLSCSWDERIVQRVAEETASELRAAGIHVNFSPMTDLVRDARWGRVMESFGEDHLLSGELGKAMIRGYQKIREGHISPDGVAACLKHFAAYGAGIGGKDYNTVDMSMREFFEYYGKPYEIALEERPRFVMSSFNAFNGVPVTASPWMLKEILRDRYGFEDLVISDWGAVSELQRHRVARDGREAAELALDAGVDIEMVSTHYLEHFEAILEKRPELLQDVDAAVLKVLRLKNEMGLFENPYADEAAEDAVLLNSASLALAEEAGIRSSVLLKNENETLPLRPEHRNVVLVGPFARTRELLGNWACKGRFGDTVTLEEGLKQADGSLSVDAFDKLEDCPEDVLARCDYVIVTVGEHWGLSGEGHSSVKLELDDEQKRLIRAVKITGRPYACVIFSGRPLALQDIIDDMPALLWCWYPGTRAGAAVAKLLTGQATPSGKLTMSFLRDSAQTPIYYNEHSTGRPANTSSYSSRYQDCDIGPLFPFGHGLTYAGATYSDFAISGLRITETEDLKVTFRIHNPSRYDFSEIAILYIEDAVSRAVRPVREMKAYRVVPVPANGSVNVEMSISLEDLKYLDADLRRTVEPGEFRIYVNDLEHPVFTIEY
ncbi:glycoside hydrolase family 3 N-terminal domain-containing protein [Cohnella sp. REN36]|uniref:glycoside hydrolase family 3 N-terminal domain-containing protein n=1 Tax=Cohnella sp. REN36 TaxID=2887347 RepID=UPI001D15B7C5|nr:glycoside hydrolase family 3 N-terminal domain-containing protein [Cohnella sp. REN36]MCC3374320.1 glycoside hydrolase family 3 C-terminal domain-containing protein [Cohnella sp. REN36]